MAKRTVIVSDLSGEMILDEDRLTKVTIEIANRNDKFVLELDLDEVPVQWYENARRINKPGRTRMVTESVHE